MIKTKIKSFFSDCNSMSLRCLKLSLRNPGMIVISLILPVLLLFLFVYLFGGAMDKQHFETSYLNYIVAGIIIMAIGQSASTTAVVVCSDVQKGLLDRFLSLPISRSSFLVGHTISALVRNAISVLIMFAVAFAIGFRPEAGFVQWLGIIGILVLFMLVMTLFCTFLGLMAKSPESASSAQALTQLLVFLSSGFVPTETLPSVLKAIAENQPITHIIETLRSLFFYGETGSHFLAAMLWLAGLLVGCYILSFLAFKRHVGKK